MGQKKFENAPKLSDEQQHEICTLIATGVGAKRIADHFQDVYGISLNITSIHRNYIKGSKWQPLITKIREQIDKGLAKHPLTSKVNRLNIIMEAIEECLTWRLDRIYYDPQGKEISRIEKRNVGPIAKLIEQARREIEGDKPEKADFEVNLYNIIKSINEKPKGVLSGIEVTRKGDPILDRFLEK